MTAHEFLDKEYFYLILDSRDTDIYSEDIGKAMADFARYKCQELLLLVAEKAKIKNENNYTYVQPYKFYCNGEEFKIWVDKDSILNAVDLDSFII